MLVGCDLTKTTINLQWGSGGNAVGSPVTATVSTKYTPIMWFLTPQKTLTLSASSTMNITH